MKDLKSTIITLSFFAFIFVFAIIIFKLLAKPQYICTDVTNNAQYVFDSENEMNSFCDNLSSVDDSSITSYSIYDDLINNNDSRFCFYPYIDDDNKFVITTVILDCNNPNEAKSKSIEWFRSHSYNINDYKVEYEYPCE